MKSEMEAEGRVGEEEKKKNEKEIEMKPKERTERGKTIESKVENEEKEV